MPPLRVNPVLERCLAVSGRQGGGQALRVGFLAATLALVMLGLVLVPGLTGDVDPRALAAGGGRLLDLMATVQVAAACVLTPLFMAAALQRDADPIAWDVLRSTPVRPWRIVSGLLAGRLVPVAALVLATLPALGLLRLAGGVPMQALLASTAIALTVAVVSATAAVMFAAARVGPRPSIISYLVAVAAALGLTWGLDAATAQALDAAGRRALTIFTPLNPFLVLDAQLRPGHIAPSDGWWTGSPLRSFLLLGGVLMICCWTAALALALRDGPLRLPDRTGTRPHRPIGRHPIAWRESSGRPYAALTNVTRWIVAALILTGGLTLAFMAPENRTASTLLSALLMASAAGLLTIGVLLASSAVARERDDRTLDLLLTTPLKGRDYLRGKLLGLARLLWPPALAAIVVALTSATFVYALPPSADSASGQMLPGGFIAYALSLPGLLTLGLAIGLAWSVRSRRWTVAAAVSLILTGLLVVGITALIIAVRNEVGLLGPALLGADPLVGPGPSVDPTGWLIDPGTPTMASTQISMIVGGAVGGGVWMLAALAVLRTTAHSFTPTVRRLAGLD